MDFGSKVLADAYKKLTNSKLVNYKDISLAQAYKEIINSYHNGQITLADVTEFEKAIGADGIHFTTDNFRGHKQSPTNGVYIFDRSTLEPGKPKQANFRALGGITPDRVKIMEMDIDGQRRIFEYGPDKKTGEDMWREVQAKAQKAEPGAPLTPMEDMTAKKDADFSEVQQELKAIEGFENHMEPHEKLALESAQAKFQMANKMEAMYAKILACLR